MPRGHSIVVNDNVAHKWSLAADSSAEVMLVVGCKILQSTVAWVGRYVTPQEAPARRYHLAIHLASYLRLPSGTVLGRGTCYVALRTTYSAVCTYCTVLYEHDAISDPALEDGKRG